MPISDEAKLNALTDHYKDTFQYVREFVVLRDRLFLTVLILLGLQFFQISSPDESAKAIVDFFKDHVGFQIQADKSALSAVLWFGLLATVVRYFQTNVYINRQYKYIHDLEDKLTKLFGEKLIVREGKNYLSKYPRFSKWTHFLYTWVFPALLIITCFIKIAGEWPGFGQIGFAYITSVVFCALIVISTSLYIIFLHSKKA